MSLPLQDRAVKAAQDGGDALVRMTFADLGKSFEPATVVTSLIPDRALEEGEQYRFHFNMTKCIGCRSCEIACNEQNGNPTDIRWRRIGEIEGGTYPDTQRHYLSMGCNHCLDADCVKGCPVDAYTKDPVTGIVLHSADACIGCQYCVWNCPYSVPQFNAERGVVGKCDMCHGRLTDGLEPACVNACPEAAIEIEIVNMLEWRSDYALAESPGMPSAGHTISTTRITLPPQGRSAARLERVDTGRIRPEQAHLSLVAMTTLMQAVTGSLVMVLLFHGAQPMLLAALLLITTIALNISVFHLGRPAYAWRALKMWRRSWLSREVLLFGLFFCALAFLTLAAWAAAPPSAWLGFLHASFPSEPQNLAATRLALNILGAIASALGVAGIIASAFIYLVPARPSWNMGHTPIDFLLSTALIGATLPAALDAILVPLGSTLRAPYPAWPAALTALFWIANQAVRLVRLNRSALFEHRAAATLMNLPDFRFVVIGCFGFAVAVPALAIMGNQTLACAAAVAAVLLARYLFFVSVVPLNMALTFTSGGNR
ncbi:MAG: DmsC/YnfH family molybdoenzyme membrane anchor subunit [Acidobacteriaceae bacterium]